MAPRAATSPSPADFPEFMSSAGYGSLVSELIRIGAETVERDAGENARLVRVNVQMGKRAAVQLENYHDAPPSAD